MRADYDDDDKFDAMKNTADEKLQRDNNSKIPWFSSILSETAGGHTQPHRGSQSLSLKPLEDTLNHTVVLSHSL